MLLLLILMPVLCAGAVFLPFRRQFRVQLLLGVSLVHALCVASFWRALPAPEVNGFLALDPLGRIVLSVVSALFLIVSVYMIGHFANEPRPIRTLTGCL